MTSSSGPDREGDKVRRLIAERASARYGIPGHDMQKAKDGEDLEAWADRMVASGLYRPGMSEGQTRVYVGDGPLVYMLPPERFAELYGQVPPDFGQQWLEMQKSRPRRK